ncbi:hypothetical protein JOD43_002587 [Pullulanibacillus pueri]|nr:hypothetical protein [Pullulanibacillus pueri]
MRHVIKELRLKASHPCDNVEASTSTTPKSKKYFLGTPMVRRTPTLPTSCGHEESERSEAEIHSILVNRILYILILLENLACLQALMRLAKVAHIRSLDNLHSDVIKKKTF